MLTESLWLAIISAGTAIIGYIVGLVKNSNKTTSSNFSTVYNTLLETNKELRLQNDRCQSRVDDLTARLDLLSRESEREIRKLRQENLSQAQELAQYKANCLGCLGKDKKIKAENEVDLEKERLLEWASVAKVGAEQAKKDLDSTPRKKRMLADVGDSWDAFLSIEPTKKMTK
jgi:hypothetical protein